MRIVNLRKAKAELSRDCPWAFPNHPAVWYPFAFFRFT